MTWTPERKREAAVQAPLARLYVRADTRIVERPGWYQVVTPSARTYLNEVIVCQLDAADADRVIDETVATYRDLGVRFRWLVAPHTRPADMGERLARRGFEAVPLRAMGIATAAPLAASAPAVTTSAPILEHLGFETLFHATSWSLTPSSGEPHDTSSRVSP